MPSRTNPAWANQGGLKGLRQDDFACICQNYSKIMNICSSSLAKRSYSNKRTISSKPP